MKIILCEDISKVGLAGEIKSDDYASGSAGWRISKDGFAELSNAVVRGTVYADTGWFNRSYLEHLVNAHQSGARDYSASLWPLLMFEAFLRNNQAVAPAPLAAEAALV